VTRHLLCLSDLGAETITKLLDHADRLLARRKSAWPTWASLMAGEGVDDGARRPLSGKSVALVFEKASTRTRLSLEIAVVELGGHPVFVSSSTSQMGRGEPIADTSRVLSRMVHAVAFRTSSVERLKEMAENSSVPVLNALTDASHPMQLLADLQTVRRVRGRLRGLKYVWIGDGNNMANSWVEAAGLLGLELVVACPAGYEPDPAEVNRAKQRGATLSIVRDPLQAAAGADVISTDVFISMGQEEEQAQRRAAFAGMRVTAGLIERASSEVVVLHCLPAHRGEEIDAEVIDGPRSFVWDQAEARLHTAKAALTWALEADE
jgi:ornithine carbamoyltransferase